jgi:uncharacterized MAPEG superfamily protein
MTTALWCVLVAGLLPYAGAAAAKLGTRFDNHQPRAWLAAQEGWRARANAAQANAFEAFPLFAIAVLVATVRHAPAARIDLLALLFVGARVAYFVTYLADLATLRSVVWLIGVSLSVAIFLSGT